MIPEEISLEFQRQLLGHHGGEDLRRRDGVLAGPGLLQKPEIELPCLQRLPQLEAGADEERIGVVGVLQLTHENLVEPSRHPAAGLVGRRCGDHPLEERGGCLQVAGGQGRVARGEQHGRRRRRMAGQPALEGQLRGEGIAPGAGLREKLDHLWLGRVWSQLRRLGRMGRHARDEAGGDGEKADNQVHGASCLHGGSCQLPPAPTVSSAAAGFSLASIFGMIARPRSA